MEFTTAINVIFGVLCDHKKNTGCSADSFSLRMPQQRPGRALPLTARRVDPSPVLVCTSCGASMFPKRAQYVLQIDFPDGSIQYDIDLENGEVTTDIAKATQRNQVVSNIRASLFAPRVADQGFEITVVPASSLTSDGCEGGT